MMARVILFVLLVLFLALPITQVQAQSNNSLVQPFADPQVPGASVPPLGLPETTPLNTLPMALDPAMLGPLLEPVLTPIALETPATPIVVEFFTSEGCATCLPAAEYMRALAKRGNILPLSFHVDYWDYTGWQDRFASPAYAARQRAYAAASGKPVVYTPQMVIAGAMESLATRQKDVELALAKADRRHPMYSLGLAKSASGDIHLSLPQAPLSVPASLWLVTYAREEITDIKAGENRGKRMVSVNVVRSLRKIGTWNGSPENRLITLSDEEIALKPDACAIIANEAEFGPVVAAAAWDFKDLW